MVLLLSSHVPKGRLLIEVNRYQTAGSCKVPEVL